MFAARAEVAQRHSTAARLKTAGKFGRAKEAPPRLLLDHLRMLCANIKGIIRRLASISSITALRAAARAANGHAAAAPPSSVMDWRREGEHMRSSRHSEPA